MLRLAVASSLLVSLFSTSANAQINFTDVTSTSNIDYVGESYGASWGYANDDLLPDLFVSHHRDDAGLYMNLGNGSFENRAFEIDVWQSVPRADQHGGAFADFNNDGFSDLLITAGAANNSQFLINNGFFMSDQVSNFTFDVKNWGGRMPAWFDFTNDGLLDLAVGASGGQAKFQTHEQVGGDFLKRNFHTGQQCSNNNYGQLSDLNNDGTLEWICSRHDFHPDKIYDYSSGLPWVDRTNMMPTTTSVVDSLFADLNGDLRMDMFAIRGRARVSGSEQTGNKTVETHLINFNGEATGLTFRTSGDVTFVLHTRQRNAAHVYIGASGMNAPYPGPMTPISFTLSPTDPKVVGLVADFASVPSDIGVFIGYNPGTQTWTLLDWSDSSSVLSYTYGYISSTANITNLTQENLHPLDLPKEPTLLRQTGSGFVDGTAAAGLDVPIGCVSVAAADFDNDMDLDLYIACRNAVSNAANIVLENDGSGHFSPVANAGGAAGPTGFHLGLSETVVVSDYDVDGFVDVFVTNGLKLYPELIGYTDGGPDKIFKNNGNSNRWIELDLTGTLSNADGIGAIVTVTAGGVAQRREQGGGYHRWAQNDTRLHFGLAGNTSANIEVRWPSGVVDMYNNVSANGLYEVVEQGAITRQTDLSAVQPPECPFTVGEPSYDVAVDREMYVWKTGCQANTWKVRVTGGTGPQITYTGDVETEQAPTSVTPVGLEFPWDELDTNPSPTIIDYKMIVGDARRDGFDFALAPGTSACFGVNSSVAVAYVGASGQAISLPFDLATGGPCDLGPPTVSIDSVVVSEGAATASLTVSLSAAALQTVSVQYATQNGSATAPADYAAKSGTLTFLSGQVSKTVNIALVDDADQENTESFAVQLSNVQNGVLGTATGTATIQDNDSSATGLTSWVGHRGGVSTAGNQINFSGQPNGWSNNTVNSVPLASLGFASDFEITWSLDTDPTGTNWVVGLGVTESSANRTDVDYGLRSTNGKLSVRENGSWRTNGPNMSLGDQISIVVRSTGVIEFRHNGATIYTTSFGGSPNFYVDTSFKAGAVSLSVALEALVVAPPGPVTSISNWFGATGGVSTNSSNIAYSGSPTGWNNNTVNSQSFSSLGISGNYTVSWVVNSVSSGNWIVGLGVSDSGPDWRDVDYGWRTVDGDLRVFESGAYRSGAGSSASPGDVLAIRVNGTTLEYLLNGAPVHSSNISGSEDFYIDSSFKNGAVSLADFKIEE